MRSGKLHDADWARLAAARGRLQGSPLHIDDNPMLTVMDIGAKLAASEPGSATSASSSSTTSIHDRSNQS